MMDCFQRLAPGLFLDHGREFPDTCLLQQTFDKRRKGSRFEKDGMLLAQ